MPVAAHIITLFHHRWTVPILAALHERSGARLVYLVEGVGIPRDSARHTLDALIRKRLVRRNPGYGHPLRPEYILTPRGAGLGPDCARLLKILNRIDVLDIGLRKWTMPIIAALHGVRDGRRFSELKTALPDVSPRALAQALKDMEQEALIERRIVDDYPPTARYLHTSQGRKLDSVLQRLISSG